MAKDNSIIWIIGLIVVGALLYQYSGFFGISLSSPTTQYNNQDISAEFKLTNYTNPLIQVFFNDKEIYELTVNETNETISFTRDLVNGTYVFKIKNITDEGTLKVVVSENNATEVKTINVQDPYVMITHNIPNTAEEGESLKILIPTFNPQGDVLAADSVLIDVTNPDNTVDTLTLTRSGNNFEYNFNYENAGTYQFKIKASKTGYNTKEVSAVTTVIQNSAIPLVVWILFIAIIFWVILFGIKFMRTR